MVSGVAAEVPFDFLRSGDVVMADQQHHFLITNVKTCTDGWDDKWSNTLVYDLETAGGGRLTLELTIDAAKKLRAMPEQLPAWLGRLGGVWE